MNKNKTITLTFISVFLLTIATQQLLNSSIFGMSADFIKGFMIGLTVILAVVVINQSVQNMRTKKEK